MTVYLDELFFENFIMNFIILYITSYLSKIKTKLYKLIIGASIGAIYVAAQIVFEINLYEGIFFKILLSVFIIIISFNIKRKAEFIKVISIFYLVTFGIGGASFGLAYLLNVQTADYGKVMYIDEFPLQIVVIAIFVMFTLIRVSMMFLSNRINLPENFFTVEVCLNGRSIEMEAFLDTGHTARVPYSNEEVVFIDAVKLKDIIPNEVYMAVLEDRLEKITEDEWKRRVVIIPVSTVGRKEILIGIRVDYILVHNKSEVLKKEKVVVVLCEKKLSSSGAYSALIGST